jgi:prepilin-type N-terminal cleavage/methylation domain-containing protein
VDSAEQLSSHRKAFSLVEMLVVIAIIAVVAALLLPALSRTQNQTAKAVDLNDLRQVMVAMHVYAGNSQDSLPWPNWDYGQAMPDKTVRPGWLYTLNLATNGPGQFNGEGSQLWDQLHQAKIFLCPMDRPDEPYQVKSNTEQRPMQLSSFIMNGAVIGFRSGYHSNAMPVKVSQMRGGDCLLFEANDQAPQYFNDGASWPYEGITTRHLNGATESALDGSSDYVRDDAWQTEVSSTNKNRLWCYPNSINGGDPIYGHD